MVLVYPDLPKPVGGIKQMHRVAEAIQACGHEVVLVQDERAFHPGWFHSDLPTTDRQSWSARTDLTPERDVVILAETFLPGLPAFKPGVPKILLNQNGAYSFGIVGKRFAKTCQGSGVVPPPRSPADLVRVGTRSSLAHPGAGPADGACEAAW